MSLRLEFSSKGVSVFKKYSWTRATTAWMDKVGPLVVDEMKKDAPVRPGPGGGRLKQSIEYRKHVGVFGVGLEFGSKLPYAQYVQNGSPPHLIYPRTASVLRFIGSAGDTVYAKSVSHPGMRANPFARKALMRMTPLIQRSFRETVEEQFKGL